MKKAVACILVGLVLCLGAMSVHSNNEVKTVACIDPTLPY